MRVVLRKIRAALSRVGLPVRARELRLAGRPLGTASAVFDPNLVDPYPVYALRLRRKLLGWAVWVALLAVAVLALLWTVPPVGLALLATCAAAVGALLIWARRPDPVHRSLPARADRPLAPIRDRLYFRRRVESDGPVFACRHGSAPTLFISNLELGSETLSGQREQLATVAVPFQRLCPGGFIRYMGSANHEIYRGLLSTAFSKQLINDLDSVLEQSARDWLVSLAKDSEQSLQSGISPQEPLRLCVLVTWFRVFFGFSPDEVDRRAIERWFAVADTRMETEPGPAEEAAIAELESLVRQRFAQNRGVSSALGELVRRDPAVLEDQTLMRNMIFLAHASSADTTGLLVWILKQLSDHPNWMEQIQAASDYRQLANQVVSEVLRLNQSEVLNRRTTAPITVGQHDISAGWRVRVGLTEAHRDPQSFPDPDAFDPGRFADRRYSKTEYAPFGVDHHRCVGEALARSAAEHFTVVLAREFNCRVLADGPLQRSAWRHWHPSPAWRVLIESKDQPTGQREEV